MTKGRLLALGAGLLLVGLILLWRSIDSSAEKVVVDSPHVSDRATIAHIDIKPTAPAEPVPAPDKPRKLDPKGDEFFNRFIELVPSKVSLNAMECYNHRIGSLGADQKMVLQYTVKIHNDVVSIENVHVKPNDADGDKKNTLADPALESCFIQQVARTTWKDELLPDYEWPDEIVLRPERMKKYWKSNREYVGAEAPKREDRKFEKH